MHSQQALISVSFIETTAFIEQGSHSRGEGAQETGSEASVAKLDQ